MGFDLDSITTSNRNLPPRIVLLGVEKIGKSTFAAGSCKPVFIPIKGEEGIDALSVPQFPVCGSAGDVEECITTLATTKHDYHTVVIDSTSALEPIYWDEICKKSGTTNINQACGGYGAGFKQADNVWRQLLEALDYLRKNKNMASILIGHTNINRFDDPLGESYNKYDFAIHERTANILYRWADAIWFANSKVIVQKEDVGYNKTHKIARELGKSSRVLYTQKNPSYPAGGRGIYGSLPAEVPLNWSAVMDCLKNKDI